MIQQVSDFELKLRKTITIILVLLMVLGLCSCNSTVQKEIDTEKLSGSDTTSVEMNIVDTIGTEPASIIFMGETITAPGYYQDVSEQYVPVLDDLYLDAELSFRYRTLSSEDKITHEIMREWEIVHKEIQNRGHLPYPGDGLGFTVGYALVDLDDDDSCELLILENSPHYIQTPVIKSVFAIRNGQLVCIDNGSSELNYTILADDKTFYQCIDWRSTGYADLIAFRLETNLSEFTIISEAHAALSFDDGDIPAPYWIKVENGIESSITENEFNALYEQYKNSKEAMVLDFILLLPDVVNPLSTPQPIDDVITIQIEYPAAYQGAPEEYKPILDSLFLFQERLRTEYDFNNEGSGMIGFVEFPYPRDSTLGYALIDLNNDSVAELLIGTIDGLNAAKPNAVFTLKNGQPVLLTEFWSRNSGVISSDGIIYQVGSGGAAYTYLSAFRLDKNSDVLTKLTDIQSDYSQSEGKPYYIQVIDGKNCYISEQEFFDFCNLYYNPPKRMNLVFIPIAS